MRISYPLIVISRILEIGTRFVFLGICLRSLDLKGYGEVSYMIALFQFIASALFASSLASMTRVVPEKLLSAFSFATLLLFAIFYLIFGAPALIFLFYSFLYILNGWYGVQQSQALFGILRGLAFLGQLLFILYYPGDVDTSKIMMSFVVPAIIMITQIPFRSLGLDLPKKNDFMTYSKFQFQGITFQFTKIVERWVAKIILDQHFFGLYSTFRDLINAANLTIFSPVYQTQFKRLSMGSDYRPVLRRWSIFWIVALAAGIVVIQALPQLLNLITDKLNLKLQSSDIMILSFLACLDFFKAFFLMILEAGHKLRKMLTLNVVDILLQVSLLVFLIIKLDHYVEILILFFSRMTIVTSISIFLSSRYEPVNT